MNIMSSFSALSPILLSSKGPDYMFFGKETNARQALTQPAVDTFQRQKPAHHSTI